MKNILTSLVVVCALAAGIGTAWVGYHYKQQAYQQHLEQQNLAIRFKARKLEIKLEALWNEYLNLSIEFERLVPKKPVVTPPIQSKDKEC